MRKILVSLVLGLALLFGTFGAALAITNGVPDAGKHPYVGLLIFDDANGAALVRCSGALLSPTVVLTAAHCTQGATAARIWMADNVSKAANPEYPDGGVTSYEGVPYTNPDYLSPDNPYGGGRGFPAFSYRDVGIVVLSEPVPLDVVSQYAALPTTGLVDRLASGTPVDLLGYGSQYQNSGQYGVPPDARWAGLRIRMYAPAKFVSGEFVNSAEILRVTANPGNGKGGTCFGDSGGPDLLGGTNVVLGVNSFFTNPNCAGVTYSNRVDIPVVLAWIRGFMH